MASWTPRPPLRGHRLGTGWAARARGLGASVPNDPAARLFLGGGGGSGDDYKSQSGVGGRGGGLIFIDATAISGTGMIPRERPDRRQRDDQ